MKIFLSLGSNMGDRILNLHKALTLIGSHTQIFITSESKIYETSPMENQEQGYFLNQIIEVQTKLPPLDLLHSVKKIESNMGRIKISERYQPRIIDIDILSYNELILNDKNLCIPHSEIKFRKFGVILLTYISSHIIKPPLFNNLNELIISIQTTGYP